MSKIPALRRGKTQKTLKEKARSAFEEARACRKEYAAIRHLFIKGRYRLVARAFVAVQRMTKDRKSWRRFSEESFFAKRKHKPVVGKPEHLLLHMIEYMIKAKKEERLKRASSWALSLRHVASKSTAKEVFKLLKKHGFKNLPAALKPERPDSRSKVVSADASADESGEARTSKRDKPKAPHRPPHTLKLTGKARGVAETLTKGAEVTMHGTYEGLDEEACFKFTVTRIKRRA
jgi:hypothetical protein